MASANVVEFTDSNFEQEVLRAGVPVLVDFWAEWCGPCRALSPTIDALADEFKGKVKVGKVNTDSSRKVSMDFGISAIPTVLLFKGGQLKKKFVGLTSKDDLAAAMRELTAA